MCESNRALGRIINISMPEEPRPEQPSLMNIARALQDASIQNANLVKQIAQMVGGPL